MTTKYLRAAGKLIPCLFLLVNMISCDHEDAGISMRGISFEIVLPSNDVKSVIGSVEFYAYAYASDTLQDLTQLHARWTSDKDGILFEHQLEKNGHSTFTTDKLSRNIHEITFEISNSGGISQKQSITIQNVIHLTSKGTGYGNSLEWNVPPGNIKNFKLYRSTSESTLRENLPILKGAALNQTSFVDTTAILSESYAYILEAEFDGITVTSNVARSRAGISMGMSYPLMKIVFDEKRSYVYGIVNPGSGYENEDGYGLVFINTATEKFEKRILENIRFNDLDIDPQGDRLYLSQRNRMVYILDLNTKEVAGTINLENYIRKLEVGSNNRLYYQVELAGNNNYEFRMVDLVAKKELPFRHTGSGGASFDGGDIDLDNETNTLYYSGPAKITTTFDIFSELAGNWREGGKSVTYRNGKVFVDHQLYNKDLVLLGTFLGKNGEGERIHDCNADATLAIGENNLFNVKDGTIRKSIPVYYDKAIFLSGNRLMLVYRPYMDEPRSSVYIYPFDKP